MIPNYEETLKDSIQSYEKCAKIKAMVKGLLRYSFFMTLYQPI